MSRRKGQEGTVHLHGNQYYGRYYYDVPDKPRQRGSVQLGSRFEIGESVAKRRLREFLEREGINSVERFIASTAPALTFKQQSEIWIRRMESRKRKPVRQATLVSWKGALANYLIPAIGDLPLSEVNNGVFKMIVSKLVEAGLSAQTITTYTRPMKMVVASLMNEKTGEPVHPRIWNADFADLPIVRKEEQKTPTITGREIEHGLKKCRSRKKFLFVLLAGTGMRIGEALGLTDKDVTPDGRTITVKQSIWRGRAQQTKTQNANREIDVSLDLAQVLSKFIKGKRGFLFATDSGKPVSQDNVRRTLTANFGLGGFHRFRRFRSERIREAQVPDFLEKYWMGHSRSGISDHYAKRLLENGTYRRQQVDRVDLGFDLSALSTPQIGNSRQQTESMVNFEVVVNDCTV